MPTSRFERFLPVAGVLAGLIFLAATVLTISQPSSSGDAAVQLRWFTDHQVAAEVANFGAGYVAVLMLLFVTGVRQALRSGEPGESTYSSAAFAGGIGVALSTVVMGAGSLAATEAASNGNVGSVAALGFLNDFGWVPWVASAAVLYLAVGLGGLRTATLPKWLAIVSIVLGVLCLTGPTGIAVYLLTPLWLIATGIVLYRRAAAAAADPRIAPMAEGSYAAGN